MNTEMFLAIVPWLAVLACPAMMFFMMRGMPGGSCHKQPAEAKLSGISDEEIRRLQARVAEMEARDRLTEVSR